MIQLLALGLILGRTAPQIDPDAFARLNSSVGQAVDIAPSAYQFRADRKAGANQPESWLALMHAANLPLNRPINIDAPAIRHSLLGLLWEEIRPVQTVELTWAGTAKHQPAPGDLVIAALINQGASSSWWNNLSSVIQGVKPTVSNGGRTYSYALGQNLCGLVLSVLGSQAASKYDVPNVRVLVPNTWKRMDLEIEWGFDSRTSAKDFSGRLETYDGRVAALSPLLGDPLTSVIGPGTWRSSGAGASNVGARRGVRLSLLYMGTSKWRRQQQYTTQPDDVARTIVTVWTRAGNFSFLAADLENGPILAPEYGFFVRRTSPLEPGSASSSGPLKVVAVPLAPRMTSVAGESKLKGWGSDGTPWFASNTGGNTVNPLGIDFPPGSVAMHPGQYLDVVAQWRSPIVGKVAAEISLAHAQSGGNGIEWWIAHDRGAEREILAHGTTDGIGEPSNPPRSDALKSLRSIAVRPGELLSLVVGPKGDHRCDTTIIGWKITEDRGSERVWDLASDVSRTPTEGNPHRDSLGNPDVWRFCSEQPMFAPSSLPSEPPIELSSTTTSARAFEAELGSRRLSTIRGRTRTHPEQTWEHAVTATRGTNLPPIPVAPVGSEPPMQVVVPSTALTAQWNLGAWHLLRHCSINPKTGELWFNDYPYGILAAETYLILSTLDLMGESKAASDGFDQWLSLPLDRNPRGTEGARALPDHPVGLFSEGHGALTYAEGPPGYGGQMDGIHAFGPGSIGWALTQHYWMTGDLKWLKAAAPRILANAEWMLRQRQVLRTVIPGGERLWCRGLEPALQVTPDSGGLWMQFYECEGYYWASISRLAVTLAEVDPVAGAKLKAEAESYRKDLRAAVERSIALSPVVPVRDGTFHSVIPFACYVRGLSTGSWGWQRDGSGSHVGPLYWDTVQTAAALVSPAGLLAPDDVRVQGYLDVLEDRLLLENANVGNRNWFFAGWQYQGGLERTANMHLAADDIPVFLRSFLNCYAVDILPKDGYVFNEHAVHGPPDKIFEEAAFLERFRDLLVMEDGLDLWLARGTPRTWLEQGKRISVRHSPTRFGTVEYEIVSDVDYGKITATVSIPTRRPPHEVLLRLRHPSKLPMLSVTVNGKPWKDFDAKLEVVKLHRLQGVVVVEVRY